MYCQALAPNPLCPTQLQPSQSNSKPQLGQLKQISGGQQEEGNGVVHHVQGEHHQTYLLHQHPG